MWVDSSFSQRGVQTQEGQIVTEEKGEEELGAIPPCRATDTI